MLSKPQSDFSTFYKSGSRVYKCFLIICIACFCFFLYSLSTILISDILVNKIQAMDLPNDGGCNCNYRDYILGPGAEQSDPCLVDIVRNEFLIAPSTLPYNLDKKDVTEDIPSNIEKFKLIEQSILDKNKPGFFIECGANDGEFISPTLRLEKMFNWEGLLIEGNPGPFATLATKNRKSWLVNSALCIQPYAGKVTFFTNPSNTGLAGFNAREKYGVDVRLTVQCLPLFTILTALNKTEVDFFSLDVEGMELAILKTIPFDKIKFKFLSIEHGLIPEGKAVLKEFMESKGYFFLKEINDHLTGDLAFVHKSLRSKFQP